MELKENEKYCPKCGKVITFYNKYKAIISIKNGSLCKNCCRKGEKNPMFGKPGYFKNKKLTNEHKEKIKKNHADVSGNKNPMFGKESAMKGKKHTKDAIEKISKGNKGKIVSKETKEKISKIKIEYYKTHDGATLGKKHSDEAKNKMRISAIKRISKCKFDNNQFYPCYNKKSISIIEDYAKKNNFNFVHAENEGEYYINELGYWLDGYDIEKNTAIEFNEKYHKYIKDKDIERRKNIINFLKCDFIIINEDGTINILKYDN